MPSIPVTSPYSYLGVFMFLIGGFLILSGLQIIRIEKISVDTSRKTLITGIVACIFGGIFLFIDQSTAKTKALEANVAMNNPQQANKAAEIQPTSTTTLMPAIPFTAKEKATSTPVINYLPTYAAMHVTVSDSFQSNENKWPEEVVDDEWATGSRKIVNGTYQFDLKAKKSFIYRAANFTVKDFWMNVDARIVRTTGNPAVTSINLFFRDNNSYNYYVLYIYMNGYFQVDRSMGLDDYETLIERTYRPALKMEAGKTYRYGVLAEGSKYTLFVNGLPFGAFEDDAYTDPGQISIGVGLNDEGDEILAQFDNLEVREP